MFERMNRRLEALQKQIDAEKERQGQATTGLTTTTAVERHHAKREEERKMADFQDTDPASGVPLCTPPSGLGRPLQFSGDVEWMPPIKFQNSDGTPAKRDGDTVTITVEMGRDPSIPPDYSKLQRLDPRRDGDRYFDDKGQELPKPTTNDEWQKVSAILRQTTGIGIRTAHDKRKIGA